MSKAPDDEPRSFRLSHGPSDLWILFAFLVFGAVLIIAPAAGLWIMRAGWLIFALVLLRYFLSVRHLVIVGAWQPSPSSILGTAIALGVLATADLPPVAPGN